MFSLFLTSICQPIKLFKSTLYILFPQLKVTQMNDFSIRHISERFRIDDILRIGIDGLQNNIYPLQGVLKNISYGIVHDGDTAMRPAREIGHTIRVMQVALQYQLHTQKQLTDHIKELNKKNKLLEQGGQLTIRQSNTTSDEIDSLKQIIQQLRSDLSASQADVESERTTSKELVEAVKGLTNSTKQQQQQQQSTQSNDLIEKVLQIVLQQQTAQKPTSYQPVQSVSPYQHPLQAPAGHIAYIDPVSSSIQSPVTHQSIADIVESILKKRDNSHRRDRDRDRGEQSLLNVISDLVKNKSREKKSRRRRRADQSVGSSSDDSFSTKRTNSSSELKDVLSQLLHTRSGSSKRHKKSSRSEKSSRTPKKSTPVLKPFENMVVSPLLQPVSENSFRNQLKDKQNELTEAAEKQQRELQLQQQRLADQTEQLRLQREDQARIQQHQQTEAREAALRAQQAFDDLRTRELQIQQQQQHVSQQSQLQEEQQAALEARKREMDHELQKKKQQLEQESRDKQIEESIRKEEAERTRQIELRTQSGGDDIYRPALLKPITVQPTTDPVDSRRSSAVEEVTPQSPESLVEVRRDPSDVPVVAIHSVPVPKAVGQKPIPCGSCGLHVIPSDITDHRVNHCTGRLIMCVKCGEEVVFSALESHRLTCIHCGDGHSASTCSTTVDSDVYPEILPSRSQESVTWKLSGQQPTSAMPQNEASESGVGIAVGDSGGTDNDVLPLKSELSVQSLRSKIAELELEEQQAAEAKK